MKQPIEKQPNVETSTLHTESYAKKIERELTEALHYKFCMFDIPVDDGPNNNTSAFCDNQSVYQNRVVPASTLIKRKRYSRDGSIPYPKREQIFLEISSIKYKNARGNKFRTLFMGDETGHLFSLLLKRKTDLINL